MAIRPASLLHNYIKLGQFDIHKALIENKLKSFSSNFKGAWLDVGAGDQPYRKFFSEADSYITTNTRRHYSQIEQKKLDAITSFWIEDGKELPLENESLDGVVCLQVLSVISEPKAFFKEINRVLKPGGTLLLTTDFLYPVWSDEDFMRHTVNHLNKLATECGFEPKEAESFGGFASTIYALVMRYLRSFPGIWKSKNTFSKIISGIFYIFLLALLPIISLKGYCIFLIEKGIKNRTNYTFNIWFVARKPLDL